MIEIKMGSQAWDSPFAMILPTANLTVTDKRKIEQRLQLITAALRQFKEPTQWFKITRGIFKGTIFKVAKDSPDFYVHVFSENYLAGRDPLGRYYGDRFDASKRPQYAEDVLKISAFPKTRTSDIIKPIKMNGGWLIMEFMASEVFSTMSYLVDYQGGEVFCVDKAKRPPTFEDRLGQEVSVGDLVVAALNYGEGLDICVVRGFADEERVIIDSVDTGQINRIPLKENATTKIMRMPNSLDDIALMLKLAR